MTAFLNFHVVRAHAAPVGLCPGDPREALRRAEITRPVVPPRWFTAPDGRLMCQWESGRESGRQTNNPAPEFPPD